MSHQHTCGNHACKFVWNCTEPLKDGVCVVTKAAKINGNGPYCELCRHYMMAKRIALLRHIDLRKFYVPS